MSFPCLSNNDFQERAGILRVANTLNAMRCLFRETPNQDVGIDGQVEFVDDESLCTVIAEERAARQGAEWEIGNAEYESYIATFAS